MKVSLIRKPNGGIEWVPANKVRAGEVVLQTVETVYPPWMAR